MPIPAAVPGAVSANATFPLTVGTDRKHLVDAAKQPFLMVGDAPWSLIAEPTRAQASQYLRTRRAQGFNTILVSLLEHQYATNAPANAAGARPFTGAAFGTPNEAYFTHADAVLAEAASLGFLVLLTPAYAGFNGGSEGWYQEMKAAGATKLRAWGQYVGRRYAANDHIMWVEGGDYDVPDQSLVDAIAEGIASVDPVALQTYHASRGVRVADRWGSKTWLDVDSVYTDSEVLPQIRQSYSTSPRPFFHIESYYENENGLTNRVLRRQAWQATLGGSSGHIFGNDPMWSFGAKNGTGAASWQQQLSSQGARSMSQLAVVLGGVSWGTMVPDTSQRLLKGSSARGDDPVAMYAAGTGEAVVYLPRGGAVSLDLSVLGGTSASLTWADPSSTRQVSAGTKPTQGGPVSITAPGANDDGDADWVLVVRRAGGTPGTPGTQTGTPASTFGCQPAFGAISATGGLGRYMALANNVTATPAAFAIATHTGVTTMSSTTHTSFASGYQYFRTLGVKGGALSHLMTSYPNSNTSQRTTTVRTYGSGWGGFTRLVDASDRATAVTKSGYLYALNPTTGTLARYSVVEGRSFGDLTVRSAGTSAGWTSFRGLTLQYRYRAGSTGAADVLYATTSRGALYQVTAPNTATFAPKLTLVRSSSWTFDQLATVGCGSRSALLGIRTGADQAFLYRVDSYAGTSSVIRGFGQLGSTWAAAHTAGAWDSLLGPARR
ncbi:hypothetical protein GCM10022415_02500 [Knoellia locipacati]